MSPNDSESSSIVRFHSTEEAELTHLTVMIDGAPTNDRPLPTITIDSDDKKMDGGKNHDDKLNEGNKSTKQDDNGKAPEHESSQASSVDVFNSPLKMVLDVKNGLSLSVVESQRTMYGWNESVEKQTPWYIQVFLKFWGPVPWMIEAAMIISFILGENEDGGIIGFLLVMNACIALREEIKAKKAVAELKEKLQILTRCKREGEWCELSSRELVPGDLIRVRHGDICPADVAVVEGHLEADQSALTGESELKYLQKAQLCYAGSIIKKGEATAIVWATGEKTFFGLTAKLVQSSKPSDHVQAIMGVFVRYFMSVIVSFIIVTIIVLAIRREDIAAAAPLLLAVLVTAAPVALPVIFTVSMAYGSQALVSHQVLVTRLNVLEDAPQMRILFSDKTGTLTLNKLSVQGVYTPSFSSYSKHSVLFASVLCSKLENADPIDLAIIKHWNDEEKQQNGSCATSVIEVELKDEDTNGSKLMFQTLDANAYQCVRFLPFDAETRRTDATLVRAVSGGVECIRVLKGAVATICSLCGIENGSTQLQEIEAIVKQSSAKGFRTIAVCARRIYFEKMNIEQFSAEISQNKNDLNTLFHSFNLLGILSFYDPPRPDTLQTLRQLNDLGIHVKMLTGDNHLVACEIARQLQFPGEIINLEEEKKKFRASANDPAKATEEWILSQVFAKYNPISDEISGFAQIFPSDKHAIVQYAQSAGIICGMTGDGVNDAPALKAAEVGVAMSNATDIAKMAASACMLAEGLSGILPLVRVGRIVHRRASVWIIYKIAKSFVHSIFILVFYLSIGYFPINTLQVIALLLLMDFVLISIATDNQQGAPQPVGWSLSQYFRIGLVLGILGGAQLMAIILYADYAMNLDRNKLNTLSFCLMFFFGFFDMLSCREKVFFWKSAPSTIISFLFLIESIAVLLCCVFGIPGLTGIGAAWIFASVGIGFVLFVLDDFLKGIYSIVFEKEFVKSG